jgi:hypothetical protein
VAAGACGPASIPSNPPTVTDTVVIEWASACVPDGVKVSFIAKTPNGPLGFVSGFWTDAAGVNIGGCGDCGITSIFLPPGFGALKIQTRYRPLGPIFYTKWGRFLGQPCWWRWCCNPWGWSCECRLVYCPFTTRFFRLFELPPWIPLTRWQLYANLPPAYWWQRTTVTPPPNERIKGPWNNILAGGPFNLPWYYQLLARYTDDGGDSFREAADFTSAFGDMWLAMQVIAPLDPNNIDPNGPPGPIGFSQTTQFIAPGYFAAANALNPLLVEIQDVALTEPSPLINNVMIDVQIVQLSLQGIGNQMVAQDFNDPIPYFELRDGLNALGADLIQVGVATGSPRFQNAAQVLFAMSDGADVALQQVLAGFPDACSFDYYLYGLMNRFTPNLQNFAAAMMPHVALQLDLGDYVWFPNSSMGAIVRVQDADTNQILEELALPVSDLSTVYLPAFNPSTPINIEIKLPTHLSRVVNVASPDDGVFVVVPPLIQGDTNGDNCVDPVDVNNVLADQGLGGLDAESVPPTDVNADGFVDNEDLNIVVANAGQCGETLPTIPCPGDTNNDGTVNITDLGILLSQFGQSGPGLDGDVNHDGTVNITDLGLLLANFGVSC